MDIALLVLSVFFGLLYTIALPATVGIITGLAVVSGIAYLLMSRSAASQGIAAAAEA